MTAVNPADSTALTIVADTDPQSIPPITRPGFQSAAELRLLTSMAMIFAKSHIVPAMFRLNPNNAMIACHMATRMQCDPLTVMQNLYVVNGKPSWSSQFLIALWNGCGRFTPIRFDWVDGGCRAYSTEHSTQKVLRSPAVTIAMAKAEGWYGKDGSKWKTMPEQMQMYRSAAFLCRAYAPELTLGLHTSDEMEDATGLKATQDVSQGQLEDLGKVGGNLAAMKQEADREADRAKLDKASRKAKKSTDDVSPPAEPAPAEAGESNDVETVSNEVQPDQTVNESLADPDSLQHEVVLSEQLVGEDDLVRMQQLLKKIKLPIEVWKQIMLKNDCSSARELTKEQGHRVIAWLENKARSIELTQWANGEIQPKSQNGNGRKTAEPAGSFQ